MSCLLLWMLLIALPSCGLLNSKVEPFMCAADPLYNEDGTLDETAYVINKACYRGMQARLNACYRE